MKLSSDINVTLDIAAVFRSVAGECDPSNDPLRSLGLMMMMSACVFVFCTELYPPLQQMGRHSIFFSSPFDLLAFVSLTNQCPTIRSQACVGERPRIVPGLPSDIHE